MKRFEVALSEHAIYKMIVFARSESEARTVAMEQYIDDMDYMMPDAVDRDIEAVEELEP